MIGDTETAALVGCDGSIDWLCLPRFDSGACFAALLGDDRNGRFSIAPAATVRAVRRRYRPGTLVLETEMDTDEGTVRITDCMPPRDDQSDLVRIVEGVSGRVHMRVDLLIRTDYGSVVPWGRQLPDGSGITAIAGPDAICVRSPVHLHGEHMRHTAEFVIPEGERMPFVLTWHPSHFPPPEPLDGIAAVDDTTAFWEAWSSRSTYDGEWAEIVNRSVLTLKGLTFAPTGGIVAAPTT